MRRPLISYAVPVVGALLLAFSGLAARQAGPGPAPPGPSIAASSTGNSPSTARRSPSNANYQLRATLDTLNHQIQGQGTLTWRNISAQPATELRFHLYWNAWRDPYSTYFREERLANVPVLGFGDADRGLIDLTSLRLLGATATDSVDLLPRLKFIAPDDGNSADKTLVSVGLDKPVAPGETIRLSFGWLSHVPRPFDRTGVVGNYYFIGQWFPKIGVLDDAGWRAHQFHESTEYFADFGTYDVELVVPAGWVVGATGRETSRADTGTGTATHRYQASDVIDFAWTTSPDFIESRQSLQLPGRAAPVNARLLLQPDHRRQADRHWAAMRLALERYSQWLGPFPYDEVTVVDPVAVMDESVQGSSTGGMEYPQLITADTTWVSPAAFRDPEDVIIHELGHQYFQSVVATNEVEFAWMDEGLATYLGSKMMADEFPWRFRRSGSLFGGLVIWPYQDAHWTRSIDGDGMNRFRLDPHLDVPSTPSWQYSPSTGRTTTYFRTTLWLRTLENMIGWETMRRVLSTYYARYNFAHPGPDDFFRTVNEVSGRDLTWFFDAVHRTNATFDYAVNRVTTLPLENGSFDTVVTVRRLGTGVFPLALRVTFDDGASVTEQWDGAAPWKAFTYRRGTRAKLVELDPEYVLRLDVHRVNNSWTSQPHAAAAGAKWGLRWFAWLEHHLLTYAFFV